MPIKTLSFTEVEIQQLFGHEAAEDEVPERLREYYFKNATYDEVVTPLPLRILVGHKGIGKSALFQVAIAEDHESNRLTLVVKPDDVVGMATDTQDFLTLVREWKTSLSQLLARKAILGLGGAADTTGERLRGFGGKLIEFLRGVVQDEISFVNLDPAKQAIAHHFLNSSEISVYIDDLDRGWVGRRADITRISALLSAVRDIANDNRGIRFRIALRSDVYFLVRTSDESTDKIEGSVIWQSWTQPEIFALLVKRVSTFFGEPVDLDRLRTQRSASLAYHLDRVFVPRFEGKGHWSNAPTHRVLMSLIRKRPRDLVKLCSLAGREARRAGSSRITTRNLESVFEEYSQGRIQDTINEFRSELPEIERLLLEMKPTKKERTAKAGYVYTTDSLLNKINNIRQHGEFRFAAGRVADAKDLAAFMYKINFLTARKDMPDFVVRRYFEESRYLQSKFVDFGFDWEIHPAYRWALQPDSIDRIFAELKLTSDDSW